MFDEKDWTGIRMLQDSVKEKEPMKVGRFGLGFKSVLHMTGGSRTLFCTFEHDIICWLGIRNKQVIRPKLPFFKR